MLRALAVFVGALLAVGVYAIVTGSSAAHAAAPEGATSKDFGFALAAGAVALAATLMVSRPRRRMRP